MSVDTNPIETHPPQEKAAVRQYRKYEWPADRVTEAQLNEMREVSHLLKRPVNQLIARAVTEFAAAVNSVFAEGPMREEEIRAIERGKLVWQPGQDGDRSPREEDLLAELTFVVDQVAVKLDFLHGIVDSLRHELRAATGHANQAKIVSQSEVIIEQTIVTSIAIEVAESHGEQPSKLRDSAVSSDFKARQLPLFDKTQFD